MSAARSEEYHRFMLRFAFASDIDVVSPTLEAALKPVVSSLVDLVLKELMDGEELTLDELREGNRLLDQYYAGVMQ